jgi:hypothetical protein
MEQPSRTLVAVIAGNGAVHTLYFSDGTVVGYEPDHGRVTRVHRLPADFGPGQSVERPRHTPAIPLQASLNPPDRRSEDADPGANIGRRYDDADAR